MSSKSGNNIHELQPSNNLTNKIQQLKGPSTNEKSKRFPKKVGIVFIGKKRGSWENKRSKLYLDFDEVACAHLLLQMNYIQNLFEFQILSAPDFIHSVSILTKKQPTIPAETSPDDPTKPAASADKKKKIYIVQWEEKCPYHPYSTIPKKFSTKYEYGDYIIRWFDEKILNKLQNNSAIDYWIGITSLSIGGNYFADTRKGESERILNVITSELWERQYSPPSIYEYFAITTFKCTLRSLYLEFIGKRQDHAETRGCIFDFTREKRYKRISVSNPKLCSSCKEDMQQLETNINGKLATCISLDESINQVLSREWLGSLKKEDSPVYNLMRNYRRNVDVNSGFYKKWWEKARDKIKENAVIWLTTGLIGTIFALIGNLVVTIYHLKQ